MIKSDTIYKGSLSRVTPIDLVQTLVIDRTSPKINNHFTFLSNRGVQFHYKVNCTDNTDSH